MRAAVLHGPGDVRIDEVPEPVPGRGEVLVAVAACGICGSDLRMYRHGGSSVPPEPFGHEFAGTIVERGPDVDPLEHPLGARVVVNPIYACGACVRCTASMPHLCEHIRFHGCFAGMGGGMSQRTVVRAEMAVPLPPDLSFELGALVEPLAVGHHAVALADTELDDRVIVVGAGPIGIATALALRARGVEELLVVERSETRRSMAGQLGLETVDPTEASARMFGARIAFDCAGTPAALAFGIDAVVARGTLVIVAAYHGMLPVPAMSLMTSERRVISSFAYAPGTFAQVIDLMASGAYPTSGWVHHVALDEILDEGIAALEAGTRLKVLVDLS